VLLLSHWDSRPWADEDKTDKNKPIDAADDGASGVGVLLEIATHLKQQAPMVGVDMLLVDAEDVGKSEWGEDSYCLGTQYWAANKHIPGYQAMFGICLDMVGAKGAQFPLETYSKNMAGSIQKEIWETAARIGFSSYFPYAESAAITDDHVTINQKAGIPCVDIIYLKPDGRFGDHWHTHNDRLDIIDTGTLKAVGQTVMEVIYSQH
ncbi:MAG TPA: M28 family peptidase, partial [Chitinophagaceae bacterium]|nr:M28 family peptidase [Chitinophagaceae bacterium]